LAHHPEAGWRNPIQVPPSGVLDPVLASDQGFICSAALAERAWFLLVFGGRRFGRSNRGISIFG
jgi:hypothetical protein